MSANDSQIGGNHYKGKRFQPWDWDKYGIGTYEMDILHYITRQKNGVEDLEKAVHYCEKLAEEYTLHERRNRIPAVLRSALVQPMQDYCNEWNMNTRQRAIVSMVLLWCNDYNLHGLKTQIELLIQETYGANTASDVRSSGGVESPESH